MEGRRRRVDDEPEEHEVVREMVAAPSPWHVHERDRPGVVHVHENACQDAYTAEVVPDHIPNRGSQRFLRSSEQDQEEGSPRHHFQAEEQGEQVSGEDRTERASDVDHRRHVFPIVLYTKGVDVHAEGGDQVDVAEDHAQLVDSDRLELVLQERKPPLVERLGPGGNGAEEAHRGQDQYAKPQQGEREEVGQLDLPRHG